MAAKRLQRPSLIMLSTGLNITARPLTPLTTELRPLLFIDISWPALFADIHTLERVRITLLKFEMKEWRGRETGIAHCATSKVLFILIVS